MQKRFTVLVLAAVAAVVSLLPGQVQSAQQLDKELYVYNWAAYIDEDLLPEYEQQYGVRIVYDNYASNEELFAKLQAGAEYDVIFPSDYMVARLIELGLLAKIDRANVPNWKNIDQANLDVWYDPGGEYCLPWMWSTTGIAYHVSLERVPDSWGALFDPEQVAYYTQAGGINLLDDQRELIGAVLKYLGYSVNETDRAKLEEARDLLLKALPSVRYINSADYQQTLLPSKEVVISHSWSGSTAEAALATISDANPKGEWRHVTPKEGGIRTQDSVCITARSTHKATAEHFINFIIEAKNAARTSNVTGYLSANMAAREFIDPLLLEFLPSQEQIEKMEWIRPLDEEGLHLWDRIWTEIRAQ